MYNTEKFVGACLESLLAQTFKDFEVIVADHCSTDKSCEVVESYIQKFLDSGIQLKILRLKKNFGNPCVPSNRGLNFSCGKYVYFQDSDDLLMKNALEIFYNYAENYNADVICAHRYYIFENDADQPFPKQLKIDQPARLNEPVIASENIGERINDFMQNKIRVMPWQNFSRRDFLIENDIYFPEILVSQDDLWIMKIICTAKIMLYIPDILYINRENKNSLTRSEKTPAQKITYHLTPTIAGMKFMRQIFNDTEFFKQNPNYWYFWVTRIAGYGFHMSFESSLNLNQYEFYNIIKQAFSQELGEHTELVAYLCSMINSQQKELAKANTRIAELEQKGRD